MNMDEDKNNVGTGCASPEKCDQCQEYISGWKRALADYDNLQKDLVRARGEMQRGTVESFFDKLIPVIDHFDQALANTPELTGDEIEAWINGVRHIRESLVSIATEFDAHPIEPEEQLFDPVFHEAVSTEADETKPDEIIIKLTQRGWKLGDKVIRPAKVIVNKLS